MKAIFNDHLNVDPKKSMSLYRTAVYLNAVCGTRAPWLTRNDILPLSGPTMLYDRNASDASCFQGKTQDTGTWIA